MSELAALVIAKRLRLKALLDEAWLLQAEETDSKRTRLRVLLAEAWPLEAELNELHRLMRVGHADRVMVQSPESGVHGRLARATIRHDVTEKRIRIALLNGPLALKGQRYNAPLLVERCEDIPGANVIAVRRVLRALVKRGFIRRHGNQFWRAA